MYVCAIRPCLIVYLLKPQKAKRIYELDKPIYEPIKHALTVKSMSIEIAKFLYNI